MLNPYSNFRSFQSICITAENTNGCVQLLQTKVILQYGIAIPEKVEITVTNCLSRLYRSHLKLTKFQRNRALKNFLT